MSLEVTYKGRQIAELTENGDLTLNTAGKYCEDDIELEYSGGGAQNQYYYGPHSGLQLLRDTALFYPEDANIIIDARTTLNSVLRGGYNCPGYTEAHIINCALVPATGVDCSYLIAFHRFSGTRGFKRLYFDAPILVSASCNYMIYDSRTIEEIHGDFDMSLVSTIPDTTFGYSGTTNLALLTFVRNSIKASAKFTLPALNDTSLVSIANGLDGTVTGKTITHHATPKARCSTLMGTVADGVFTQDAQGTVTLADFITNTKGWTLA